MPDTPTPTSDLAADVRRFLMMPSAIVGYETTDPTEALDALVARVTDLEAHATRVTDEWQAAEAQVAALTHQIECAHTPLMRDVLAERDAARAEVAALTAEHHRLLDELNETAGKVAALTADRDEWRDLAAKEAKAGIARDKERMAAEAALAEEREGSMREAAKHGHTIVERDDALRALATTRQALADMVSDADATQGALDQHSGQGRMAALASLGNRLADAARQILAATDTTTNEKENDQ